jgi:hypothetical protein
MSIQLLNQARQFQIWKYTVSHRELLLRSVKGPVQPPQRKMPPGPTTRFDVLFTNVAAIHLPTRFDGLTILEAEENEKKELPLLPAEAASPKYYKVFIVRGTDFSGYVIAADVFWHEDEYGDSDPSHYRLQPSR